ncbi:hypothetical protein SUGI_0549210 [Cryptomeria japonica]|nr:hypothetical protein SUGI_0549210 [Cryptomeria japonica]
MKPEVFTAAKNGDLDAIKKLHEQNPRQLNEIAFEGNTVLHIAAREGHSGLVEWILQNVKGCRMLVARNTDRNTPLHEAAKRGNTEIISTLLRHNKCAAAKRNQLGESALIIASEHGHEKAARDLVEATPVYIIFWPRNDHQTCLHVAAYGGHLGIVNAILQRNSFYGILQLIMIIRDRHGATPLHSAVHKGNVEIVSEILKKQLNSRFCIKWFVKSLMEKKDKLGRCAIHLAAIKGNRDMMDEFRSKMPDCLEIHSAHHKTALHFAVEYNQFDMVKKLLPQNKREEMADLVKYDRDMYGNTLLHLAALNQVDPELVEYLLPFVNLDAINNEGRSAFDIHIAAAAATSKNEPKFTKITDILKGHGASERSLKSVDFKQESYANEKIMDVDTLVASLIATITFAAIFTVPGGIDDKDCGNYNEHSGAAPTPGGDGCGVARMALKTLFQVFLFSDSLAMFASLTVVIAWLFRERLQTKLIADRSLLAKLSVLSLGVSIISTGLAFLSATILVTVPRDDKKNNNRSEYDSLLWAISMFTAVKLASPLNGQLLKMSDVNSTLWVFGSFSFVYVLVASSIMMDYNILSIGYDASCW